MKSLARNLALGVSMSGDCKSAIQQNAILRYVGASGTKGLKGLKGRKGPKAQLVGAVAAGRNSVVFPAASMRG